MKTAKRRNRNGLRWALIAGLSVVALSFSVPAFAVGTVPQVGAEYVMMRGGYVDFDMSNHKAMVVSLQYVSGSKANCIVEFFGTTDTNNNEFESKTKIRGKMKTPENFDTTGYWTRCATCPTSGNPQIKFRVIENQIRLKILSLTAK